MKNSISKKGDVITIDYDLIKNNKKLYLCSVSKEGIKQFNVIDIENLKQLIIDIEMPTEIFNHENKSQQQKG